MIRLLFYKYGTPQEFQAVMGERESREAGKQGGREAGRQGGGEARNLGFTV
jgi:hypothetical protein